MAKLLTQFQQRLIVLNFQRLENRQRVFLRSLLRTPNGVGDVNVLAVRKGLVGIGGNVDVRERVAPLAPDVFVFIGGFFWAADGGRVHAV